MVKACAPFEAVSTPIRKFPNESLPNHRTRLLQAMSAGFCQFHETMRKVLNLIYNFHWVVPGEVARSAQAIAGGLHALLSSQKIRGLINLRGRNPDYGWWRYETNVCREMGVAHFDAMLDSRKLPTRVSPQHFI